MTFKINRLALSCAVAALAVAPAFSSEQVGDINELSLNIIAQAQELPAHQGSTQEVQAAASSPSDSSTETQSASSQGSPSQEVSAPALMAPGTAMQEPTPYAGAMVPMAVGAPIAGSAMPMAPVPYSNMATITQAGPVVSIYEFGAKWCPSCHNLEPVVRKAVDKYKGFAAFTYVDTDSNGKLARQMKIMQIPQVLIYDKQGRMLNRLVGFEQGAQLDLILNNYVQQTMGTAGTSVQQ